MVLLVLFQSCRHLNTQDTHEQKRRGNGRFKWRTFMSKTNDELRNDELGAMSGTNYELRDEELDAVSGGTRTQSVLNTVAVARPQLLYPTISGR